MLSDSSELITLLQRTADGDEPAFASLYQATSLKLFGIVLRILKRRELAEEVLQEVYCKIWENAHRFDSTRASPITWMATIARNRALDEVRRRDPIFASDDVLAELSDPGMSPAQHLELGDELRRLEACLNGLGSEQNDLIRLAYLYGYSRAELAERFDQPVGTIKTWLHRGLKQLKDCLGS